jgi:hypothetical protein
MKTPRLGLGTWKTSSFKHSPHAEFYNMGINMFHTENQTYIHDIFTYVHLHVIGI